MQIKKRSLLLVLLITCCFYEGFGQLSILNVNVNDSITGFKLIGLQPKNGKIYYPPNIDTANIAPAPIFFVRVIGLMDWEKTKSFIEFNNDYAKNAGDSIYDVVTIDTSINGTRIYEMTLKNLAKNSTTPILNYYAFMLQGDNAIVFLSADTMEGKYLDKFRKTFRTIKL